MFRPPPDTEHNWARNDGQISPQVDPFYECITCGMKYGHAYWNKTYKFPRSCEEYLIEGIMES
jgi:hypothetical protein